MYRLDFTHAWTGRLKQPEGLSPRLGGCTARLTGELAAGRLPFLNMPYRNELVAQITENLPKLQRFKHMVVLGIGGSALGTRALQKAFFPQQDRPGHTGPWLWIADNVDADTLEAWFTSLPPEETVVLVVSKSGGTIETLSQYFLVREWLQKAQGDRWHEHMLFVTDAKAGFLREEADREGIISFPVPDHLGGRYSVFSAVGLVPAAFLGMPWIDLLDGSLEATQDLVNNPGNPEVLAAHPAWKMALWGAKLSKSKYSQLIFFVYLPLWASFGNWFAQLWAESLGKNGKGTMPLPAVGVTDQHSTNQMFLDGPADKGCIMVSCPSLDQGRAFPKGLPEAWSWLENKHFGALLEAECVGTSAALAHSRVPLLQFVLDRADAKSAGGLMGLSMAATLLAGWLLEINPLDQPAVELGKRLACARLGAKMYPDEAAMLRRFLGKESC